MQRSEDGCGLRKFRSFNHSACKTVLNLLEAIYLRLRKIVVERVTVLKLRLDSRGSGCFGINVRTDTVEFLDMRTAEKWKKWYEMCRSKSVIWQNIAWCYVSHSLLLIFYQMLRHPCTHHLWSPFYARFWLFEDISNLHACVLWVSLYCMLCLFCRVSPRFCQ